MPYYVAGVMPKDFAALSDRSVDLWLPLLHATVSGSAPRDWQGSGSFWLSSVARTSARVPESIVDASLNAVLAAKQSMMHDERRPSGAILASIVPGRGADKPIESKVALWLSGVSILVLLIACANVANLVIARNFAQRKDYFIRLSLGATTSDLARRSVSDLMVLIVPSCLGALAVSYLLRGGVSRFLSADIPLSREFLDERSALMLGASTLTASLMLASGGLTD